MKQLRMWLAVLLVTVFALVLVAGCGPAEQDAPEADRDQEEEAPPPENPADNEPDVNPVESAWEITVTGPGGEMAVAIEAIKALPVTTINAQKKEETFEYSGALLSAVLKEAGITEAAKVSLVAADGYASEISGEVAFSDNTILAYRESGADLDPKSAPIMLVTIDDTPKTWVGQLVSIIVE